MGWVESVVAELGDCKRAGLPFDTAWTNAVQRHPPRLRELGVLFAASESLFDQQGAQALEWFRGVCADAYLDAPAADGGPSRLRGLQAALMDAGPSFERVPARPPRPGVGALAA